MSGGFSHYCNSQIADIVPASFSTPVQSDIVPAVELTGIDTLKVKPDDFSVVQPFLHGEPDFEDVSLGSSGICALGSKHWKSRNFPSMPSRSKTILGGEDGAITARIAEE